MVIPGKILSLLQRQTEELLFTPLILYESRLPVPAGTINGWRSDVPTSVLFM
jgi:hypothetical protein